MDRDQLTTLAAEIVAAHVANNRVPAEEVPALLRSICAALAEFAIVSIVAQASRSPAVPPAESISPDHLVCLLCGHSHRTLTRHLKTAHGMTPQEYRSSFSLADDYPMNAATYSELRARLARAAGLGAGRHSRQRKEPAPSERGINRLALAKEGD